MRVISRYLKTMKRKGAHQRDKIPPEIADRLSTGQLETANLMEMLVIDFHQLAESALPAHFFHQIEGQIDTNLSITKKMLLMGDLLRPLSQTELQKLSQHRSDTVRGWVAYALAARPDLDFLARLELMIPLADDDHFGVREWAWLALRPHICQDIHRALIELRALVSSSSASLRRFAIESTRPRGVWCQHIEALKNHPELGLPLLEPLKADPARYVQNSVANWLNDAAKHQPEWVISLCGRWQGESPIKDTFYICKRALRSL